MRPSPEKDPRDTVSGKRTILHVDMDAFYASIEQRDNPELKGKPLIVGARSRRGVVAAASYEARPFGVRSAMSMVEALQRCPRAIVVLPRMERYAEVSEEIFSIFHRYTPLVEGISLDEAFLDVSGSMALFGDGIAIAKEIKAAISSELSLIASAGVAPNKFIAKVSSDLDKPDGLVVVAPEGAREFLAPLPIERMWGVGKKTAPRLRDVGFETLGDLAAADERLLSSILGSFGPAAKRLAMGLDDRPVIPSRAAKSVGAEQTFEKDVHSVAELEPYLLRQCARVAGRLQRGGIAASAVTVKLKDSQHRSRSRQKSLSHPIFDTDSLYEVAHSLLSRFPEIARGVRLVGISAGGLQDQGPELSLFPDEQRIKREEIEALTQKLRTKFGDSAMTRGSLLETTDHVDGGVGSGLSRENVRKVERSGSGDETR